MTNRLPDVAGRCPACQGESLMLADGGYITCRRLDCPNPEAAHTAIDEQASRNEEIKALPAENAAAIALIRRQDEAIQRVRDLANRIALDSPWGRDTAHQFRLAVQPPIPDGPTVAEAKADDRAYWTTRYES